ncbi:MAG: hypothetical protein O3C40_30960 [Planctomycetota bacterium]|nr:hypothetical protein [Planctomycetota bacterium]
MISNRIVSTLLAALAILTVAGAVLMGFQVLLSSLHDTVAARALQWIGFGCLILLVTDLVLLVGALSVRALEQDRDRSNDS